MQKAALGPCSKSRTRVEAFEHTSPAELEGAGTIGRGWARIWVCVCVCAVVQISRAAEQVRASISLWKTCRLISMQPVGPASTFHGSKRQKAESGYNLTSFTLSAQKKAGDRSLSMSRFRPSQACQG